VLWSAPCVLALLFGTLGVPSAPAVHESSVLIYEGRSSQGKQIRLRGRAMARTLSVRLSELLYICSASEEAFVGGIRLRTRLRRGRVSFPERSLFLRGGAQHGPPGHPRAPGPGEGTNHHRIAPRPGNPRGWGNLPRRGPDLHGSAPADPFDGVARLGLGRNEARELVREACQRAGRMPALLSYARAEGALWLAWPMTSLAITRGPAVEGCKRRFTKEGRKLLSGRLT